MSENETTLLTQHAMLVVWGEYARSIGLVKGIERVRLQHKEVKHSPQRKVLEFLVAILGGLPYLKDISRSAHPLDQDLAVAKAWGQTGWADQSGVSRTLSALTMVPGGSGPGDGGWEAAAVTVMRCIFLRPRVRNHAPGHGV